MLDALPTMFIEIFEVVFMYVIIVVIGGSLYAQHKNHEPLNKIHLIGLVFCLILAVIATITLVSIALDMV